MRCCASFDVSYTRGRRGKVLVFESSFFYGGPTLVWGLGRGERVVIGYCVWDAGE